VHPGAHRRQRASGSDRARRHRLRRDRVRAGSGTARRRSRAREHGVDRFGAARPDGFAALSSVAPRRAGARQAMTETKGPDRIALGEDRHRLRVPVEVQPLSAGLKGGLVGGCAMALCAAIYGLVVQHSVWYPLNLLAAIAMPRMAEADAATLKMFDGAAFVIGLIAHGVTSALVGALYAAILPLLPRRHMLWGGLIAPLLWSGFLWATLGVIDPALNAQISWTWFIASQIAFGLTAGYVVARATPVATAQTRSFPARAGVEATGLSRHEDTRP